MASHIAANIAPRTPSTAESSLMAKSPMVRTTSKIKANGDIFDRAFSTLELFDEGGKHKGEHLSGPSLSSYTIDMAQFCHVPLTHVGLEVLITALKVPEFWLVRAPHKIKDKIVELNGGEPEEIIPGLPSAHHRFIRFRTRQHYENTSDRIWGTMERLENAVVCALYKHHDASVRIGANVTQTGILPFSPVLEMDITETIGVEDVFRGIGGNWNGPYHLTDNNCIHYALECWKKLGGKATWNEVVDGHHSFIPSNYDVGERKRERKCI